MPPPLPPCTLNDAHASKSGLTSVVNRATDSACTLTPAIDQPHLANHSPVSRPGGMNVDASITGYLNSHTPAIVPPTLQTQSSGDASSPHQDPPPRCSSPSKNVTSSPLPVPPSSSQEGEWKYLSNYHSDNGNVASNAEADWQRFADARVHNNLCTTLIVWELKDQLMDRAEDITCTKFMFGKDSVDYWWIVYNKDRDSYNLLRCDAELEWLNIVEEGEEQLRVEGRLMLLKKHVAALKVEKDGCMQVRSFEETKAKAMEIRLKEYLKAIAWFQDHWLDSPQKWAPMEKEDCLNLLLEIPETSATQGSTNAAEVKTAVTTGDPVQSSPTNDDSQLTTTKCKSEEEIAEDLDTETEDSENSSTPGKARALSKEGKDLLEEAMTHLASVVHDICKKEGKSEQETYWTTLHKCLSEEDISNSEAHCEAMKEEMEWHTKQKHDFYDELKANGKMQQMAKAMMRPLCQSAIKLHWSDSKGRSLSMFFSAMREGKVAKQKFSTKMDVQLQDLEHMFRIVKLEELGVASELSALYSTIGTLEKGKTRRHWLQKCFNEMFKYDLERAFKEDEVNPAVCFNNFTQWAIRLQIQYCDWDGDVNFPLSGGVKSIVAPKLEKIAELHRKQLVLEYKKQTCQPNAEGKCTDNTVVYSFKLWSNVERELPLNQQGDIPLVKD
ncbi:hypothetical protein GYMLUDRAFT_250900 [Collybiopsis luxurians FD-317 M1]|uniref:Uncharacterized protein n=1 Tax=Collybiopsis luxurians FD-317 M1 TaxID=944289 RepID=A0A0D0AQY6_9AGAR|nr:hypothetical protein GYMLUDRAFT_250900 [Collybiopsis luxurians FD-317 M1]